MARRIVLGEISAAGAQGLKVSKAGFDAKVAADADLIFSTDFNLFKIHSTGTTSVTLPARPIPTALTAADGGAGAIAAGDYYYQVAFVLSGGLESDLGGLSVLVTIAANRQIALTSVPTGPSGTTARKIYRTSDAAGGVPMKLAVTISDNTTTTATDNVAAGSLGAAYDTVRVYQLATITTHGLGARKAFLAFIEWYDELTATYHRLPFMGAQVWKWNNLVDVNDTGIGAGFCELNYILSELNSLVLVTQWIDQAVVFAAETLVVRWYILVETG